jgi:hypothetical protein
MNSIINPGAGVLFMKVGTHAKETLEDIIARKQKEIETAGYGLWGYGGNTCHPRTMVQPFAKSYEEKGGTIYLCMEEMNSKHFAEPVRAAKFSVDGSNWQTIPDSINAVGSRFALVIKELRHEDLELALGATRVAIGPTEGRIGSQYIKGQVDKACFEIIDPNDSSAEADAKVISIKLVAELAKPYAVFLKN